MNNDTHIYSNHGKIPAYVTSPTDTSRGGIVLIHEIWGLNQHIKDIGSRLAQEGYLVVAPNLFADVGIEEFISAEMARDLFNPEKRQAIQPKLRAIMAPIQAPEFAEETKLKLRDIYRYMSEEMEMKDNIAVIGFCFGGTYSFELAMLEPRLRAAIPFYGHAPLALEDLEKIKAPVLAFYGENDAALMSELPLLMENMEKAGVDFTAVTYAKCGHAFFNDTNEYAYCKEAAQDAWEKTLRFLSVHLGKDKD